MDVFGIDCDSDDDEMDDELTAMELQIRRRKVEQLNQQISLRSQRKDDVLSRRKLQSSLDRFQMKSRFQSVVDANNFDVERKSPSQSLAQARHIHQVAPSASSPTSRPTASGAWTPSHAMNSPGHPFHSLSQGAHHTAPSSLGATLVENSIRIRRRRLKYDDLDSSSSEESSVGVFSSKTRGLNSQLKTPNSVDRSRRSESGPTKRLSWGDNDKGSSSGDNNTFDIKISPQKGEGHLQYDKAVTKESVAFAKNEIQDPSLGSNGQGLLEENQRLKETVQSLLQQLMNSKLENLRKSGAPEPRFRDPQAQSINSITALEDKLSLALGKCDDLLGIVSMGLEECSAMKRLHCAAQANDNPFSPAPSFPERFSPITAARSTLSRTCTPDLNAHTPAMIGMSSRQSPSVTMSRFAVRSEPQWLQRDASPAALSAEKRVGARGKAAENEMQLSRAAGITRAGSQASEKNGRAASREEERQRVRFLDAILQRVVDEEPTAAVPTPRRPEPKYVSTVLLQTIPPERLLRRSAA